MKSKNWTDLQSVHKAKPICRSCDTDSSNLTKQKHSSYYINMYHSKHASFSRHMERYPIQSDAIMSYTHIHTRAVSGQFCLCGTARSFSFTAQHFRRLITDTDWQDKMNPLKSAHKQSSKDSGSRKPAQTSNNSPDYFFPIDLSKRWVVKMLQFCILYTVLIANFLMFDQWWCNKI